MVEVRGYERLDNLLDDIDPRKLPDIVLQLLSEGKELQESYVMEAVEICARNREFKKAGKIAELNRNYLVAYKMYMKSGKKEDAERVRKFIYNLS